MSEQAHGEQASQEHRQIEWGIVREELAKAQAGEVLSNEVQGQLGEIREGIDTVSTDGHYIKGTDEYIPGSKEYFFVSVDDEGKETREPLERDLAEGIINFTDTLNGPSMEVEPSTAPEVLLGDHGKFVRYQPDEEGRIRTGLEFSELGKPVEISKIGDTPFFITTRDVEYFAPLGNKGPIFNLNESRKRGEVVAISLPDGMDAYPDIVPGETWKVGDQETDTPVFMVGVDNGYPEDAAQNPKYEGYVKHVAEKDRQKRPAQTNENLPQRYEDPFAIDLAILREVSGYHLPEAERHVQKRNVSYVPYASNPDYDPKNHKKNRENKQEPQLVASFGVEYSGSGTVDLSKIGANPTIIEAEDGNQYYAPNGNLGSIYDMRLSKSHRQLVEVSTSDSPVLGEVWRGAGFSTLSPIERVVTLKRTRPIQEEARAHRSMSIKEYLEYVENNPDAFDGESPFAQIEKDFRALYEQAHEPAADDVRPDTDSYEAPTQRMSAMFNRMRQKFERRFGRQDEEAPVRAVGVLAAGTATGFDPEANLLEAGGNQLFVESGKSSEGIITFLEANGYEVNVDNNAVLRSFIKSRQEEATRAAQTEGRQIYEVPPEIRAILTKKPS